MKYEAEKFQKYIAIVINQGEKSIEKISGAVGVSKQEAQEDLQKMINHGYFQNTYIDVATSEIILPDRKERDLVAYEQEKQKNIVLLHVKAVVHRKRLLKDILESVNTVVLYYSNR